MNRGIWLTLSSAVLFGSTFPAIRYGLDEGQLGPYTFALYRFLVATLVLGAYALIRGRLDLSYFHQPRLLALGALITLSYMLQFLAQERTSASKTSLLVNINVLAVVFLGFVLLGEPLTRGMLAATVLGVAGTVLLSTNGDPSAIQWSNDEFAGNLMALASGLGWAVYIIGLKHYMNRRPQVDVVGLNVAIFVFITAFLVPVAWAQDGLAFSGNARGLLSILYLGVFATALAFLAWQEGLRTLRAGASSVLLLVEIVVAVAISAAVLDERLTPAGMLGAGAIAVAAYVASRVPASGARAPSAPPADHQT